MINMHVYLPEKYRFPFLHGVFLFSKVEVLVVNFDGFFALTYSSHILWSWPLGRVWCHHTSLFSNLYLKDCQFCSICFLRKGIVEPALPYGFDHVLQFDHAPHVVNSGLWIRLYEGRFDKKLFSCRSFKFLKLIDTKIILTSIRSKLVMKKFKWFLWRGF